MFKGLKHLSKGCKLLSNGLKHMFKGFKHKIPLREKKNSSSGKRKFKVYSLKLRGSGKLKV